MCVYWYDIKEIVKKLVNHREDFTAKDVFDLLKWDGKVIPIEEVATEVSKLFSKNSEYNIFVPGYCVLPGTPEVPFKIYMYRASIANFRNTTIRKLKLIRTK